MTVSATLKTPTPAADISPTGEIVKLPNCPEVSPELLRSIARRTKNASYWAQYWSIVQILALEMDPEEVNEMALDDVWLHVLGWLYDRNRAAIKARGF